MASEMRSIDPELNPLTEPSGPGGCNSIIGILIGLALIVYVICVLSGVD